MNLQEKRFVNASLGAIIFVALIGIAGMAMPFLLFFAYLLFKGGSALVYETWNGLPNTNEYTQLLDKLFLPVAFIGLIVGMIMGVTLWNRFFVASGYLDKNTLDRLNENIAPTNRLERIRRAIGFSFFIPFLSWINFSLFQKPIKDWWGFIFTIPLLFYFIYLAYKEYGPRKK